jgi:hypothetical protein
MNDSAGHKIGRVVGIGFQTGRIEECENMSTRLAVAYQNPVRCPEDDRKGLEQFEVGRVDLWAKLRTVCLGHTSLKKDIEVLIGLEDRAVGPLSHFVVPRYEMHLLRELTPQRGEQIHQLMRFISPFGIPELPVDQFLKDEVSGGVVSQVCSLEHHLEISNVTVQIASHK